MFREKQWTSRRLFQTSMNVQFKYWFLRIYQGKKYMKKIGHAMLKIRLRLCELWSLSPSISYIHDGLFSMSMTASPRLTLVRTRLNSWNRKLALSHGCKISVIYIYKVTIHIYVDSCFYNDREICTNRKCGSTSRV